MLDTGAARPPWLRHCPFKLPKGVNNVVLPTANNVVPRPLNNAVLHPVNNVVVRPLNNVVLHPLNNVVPRPANNVVNKVVQPSILLQLVNKVEQQ